MKRRDFITFVGGAAFAWPLAARAQEAGKIPRIGVLWRAGSAEAEGSNFKSLVKGFDDLDYVEGRNIKLEHRFANDMPDRFKSMAAELVSSNVDVLISVGNNASSYAKDATTTIPVVFVIVPDPVGSKLADSLAQPGGNITGLSSSSPALFEKRMALLKEIIPALARVGVLVNLNDQISRLYVDATEAAATGLGLTVQTFEWHTVNDLGPAFDAMKRAGIQALTSSPDGSAGGAHVLCSRPGCDLSPIGCLRRQDTQGRQARWAPGGAADQIRAAHQSQNRQGSRLHCPGGAPEKRQRGG
jgi:putative tryptophan/tyrosine transport system substrate-binding protein